MMKRDAEAYTELNKPQFEAACRFIGQLNICQGKKVLDMGCGTGDVTKYIADLVGPNGVVLGIDPDEERIKIAKEKFKDINNLEFHVGNSVARFPRENEEYYDIHISTYAFHWFDDDAKRIYLQKVHQSLKPGGKLGILCIEKTDERVDQHAILGLKTMTEENYRHLVNDIGLFKNIHVKKVNDIARLSSFEELKRWAKASSHHDVEEIDPKYFKSWLDNHVQQHEDGSISVTMFNVDIIANK